MKKKISFKSSNVLIFGNLLTKLKTKKIIMFSNGSNVRGLCIYSLSLYCMGRGYDQGDLNQTFQAYKGFELMVKITFVRATPFKISYKKLSCIFYLEIHFYRKIRRVIHSEWLFPVIYSPENINICYI